jgi:hypothetical protein
MIFGWGNIISTKFSSQLSSFKDAKKFYMASNLIFTITYSHIFKGLNIGRRVNCNVHSVTMWYQALWRKNATHIFYEVYNEFVFVFMNLVFGENTSKLSQEASTFPGKKGIMEKINKYNIIRIYYLMKNPFYIPYYVPEKLFVV